MKRFYFKIGFLVIVCMLFLSPLLQMQKNIFPKLTLSGVEQPEPMPMFSLEKIKNGEFQQHFEKYLSQNLGLREYFVRTNNQIFYSVFNQTPPNSQIVVGKNGQLIEEPYISEYLNFVPSLDPKFLEEKLKQMKELQDALEDRGKVFLLLITPSKAAIYPEYIPERLKVLGTSTIRNYDLLIPLLNKYHINYTDGHKITAEQKNLHMYDMFPKGGTHWNNLAAYYTTKQAIQKIEQLSSKRMVNLELSKVNYDVEPMGTDCDLANLVNIWYPPSNYSSPHPIITKKISGDEYKPTILMEGESFANHFINILNQNNMIEKIDFYYYYHDHNLFTKGNVTFLGEIKNLDWERDVFNHDIIIVEMNEQRIPKIQQGFMQDALRKLKPDKAVIYPEEIKFTYINSSFVEKTIVDGHEGYLIKKGADGKGTLYLESEKMNLKPNQEYVVSYKAKGFNSLSCDLFPDDLPQYNNDKISDEIKDYSFTFTTASSNIQNASMRFFIDGLTKNTDKDTYLYDVKIAPKIK